MLLLINYTIVYSVNTGKLTIHIVKVNEIITSTRLIVIAIILKKKL